MELQCKTCQYEFDSGFFNNWYCPKCRSIFFQVWQLIRKGIKWAILLIIAAVVVAFVANDLLEQGLLRGISALDSRNLYFYGKEAYLNTVAGGNLMSAYTLTQDRPYYKAVLNGEDIKDLAVGTLKKGQVTRLGGVIRKGGNVFIPAEFYIGETVQRVFLHFPRHWEDSVKDFEWTKAVGTLDAAYKKTVSSGFALKKVAKKDEETFKKEYPDYYILEGFGDDKSITAAKKDDRALIESAYAYYLGGSNPAMVITQADKDWKRPALDLKEGAKKEAAK
jgi:hypothetical protein